MSSPVSESLAQYVFLPFPGWKFPAKQIEHEFQSSNSSHPWRRSICNLTRARSRRSCNAYPGVPRIMRSASGTFQHRASLPVRNSGEFSWEQRGGLDTEAGSANDVLESHHEKASVLVQLIPFRLQSTAWRHQWEVETGLKVHFKPLEHVRKRSNCPNRWR